MTEHRSGNPPLAPAERVRAGRVAESIAIRFLTAAGLQILDRNVFLGGGEIDVVAREGEVLVFVEVRSRRAGSRYSAACSVDERKRRLLTRAAAAFLSERGLAGSRCRFDVVTVERSAGGWRPRHYRSAFLDEEA